MSIAPSHLRESFLPTDTVMSDVMTRAPATIEATASVATAHEMMRTQRCRHLPVVKDGELVGVVSERDLFVLGCLAGADDDIDVVGEAMSKHVYTTTPDATLREVARVMAAEKYGSAIVLENGRIAGIFTTTDAFRHLVAALP